MSISPVPPGFHRVTPHITVNDTLAAIDFYKKAFGAVEIRHSLGSDGKVMHASIQIGDSIVMLNDEFPDWGVLGPKARGGTSVTLHLYVENPDALFDQAVAAGATAKMPMADQFWGDRYGMLEDPYGHSWSIGAKIANPTAEEMDAAATKMMAEHASH